MQNNYPPDQRGNRRAYPSSKGLSFGLSPLAAASPAFLYVIIDSSGHVIRDGKFTSAAEAKLILKPTSTEILFIKVGGQTP